MYQLVLQQKFRAEHYLIGGDWGAENEQHKHAYLAEVHLAGPDLNEHGYLVDLVEVQAALEACLKQYRNQVLNDLTAFSGLNPSLEHFARIMATDLAGRLPTEGLVSLELRLWEDANAWAGYQCRLPCE